MNHAVQSSARHEKASRDDLEETSVCFGNGVRKRNRFIMLAMKMLPYRKYILAGYWGERKHPLRKRGHPRGAYPPQKEKVIRQNKTAAGPQELLSCPPGGVFLCMNNPDILSGTPRRDPPKVFFANLRVQVFSASHWCMCSRIRAKAVAVSGLCVLKSISFHSQPWSATMQRLSG